MNPEYFHQISDAFLTCAGRGLSLSARDQTLVAGWAREGVPVSVVVDGIQKAFSGETSGRTRSMAYVVPAVDDCIVAWREKRVGEAIPHSEPEGEWEGAFDSLQAALREASEVQSQSLLASIVSESAQSVKELKSRWLEEPGLDVADALLKIEAMSCGRLLEEMDSDLRIILERKVEQAMAGQRFSMPSVHAETRRALMRKNLRRMVGLPAFELDFSGGW